MKFKKQVISAIAKVTKLKKKQVEELLEIPPDTKLGDLAFPCFVLSKKLKKAPKKIAEDLAKKIKPKGLIKEIKATGPYLNFFVDGQKLADQTLKQILKQKNKYGTKKKIKKVIIIESPSPNTNKPLHIGHLRNMALAISLSRILSAQGYDSKFVNLYNDRGIHISKSMLAYQKWGKGKKPNKKSDHFVGDYYVMFSQKAKQHPKLIDEAQQMVKDWEAHNKKVRALWKKMNSWVIKGFKQTYKRLGIKHNKTYFESKMYEKGRKIVLAGLKKNIFYKTDDGAVAIDLGGNLGEKILIRKD
ncbi:arginine--tRNA ligase [Candidatus Woesearchaeota archaeon]|nr:arginine--tRNA ligase [Candidatus Woesearchaeota archaeon]